MHAYQGILLAATLSTAGIVLADVLVQPGYHYDSNRHNPSYQPVISHHQPLLPAGQYYTGHLRDHQLISHPKRVHAFHPYGEHHDYNWSHWMKYPYHHYNHYHTLPNHWYYTKMGGHEHIRPIHGVYKLPVTGHHRFRRSSPVHDVAVEERAKPALVNREHEVATKPSLMFTKYSTVIDSHLQENEPTDTDNKRSEGKRQSKDDRATAAPFLFGLYPENMYRDSRQLNTNLNSVKDSDMSNVGKPTANSAIVINPLQKTTPTTPQGTGLEGDNKNQQQNQIPLANPNQVTSPTSISPDEEFELVGAARNYYYQENKPEWPIMSPSGIYTPLLYETWNVPSFSQTYMRNFPDPRPSYASWKPELHYQQSAYQVSDKKPSLKSRDKHNKERSKSSQLNSASSSNSNYYKPVIFCNTPHYSEFASGIYSPEVQATYDPTAYPTNFNYYKTYEMSSVQGEDPAPMTDDVQDLPQLSDDNPEITRYVALPQNLYYYYSPTLTDGNAPYEGTFSSPIYYY